MSNQVCYHSDMSISPGEQSHSPELADAALFNRVFLELARDPDMQITTRGGMLPLGVARHAPIGRMSIPRPDSPLKLTIVVEPVGEMELSQVWHPNFVTDERTPRRTIKASLTFDQPDKHSLVSIYTLQSQSFELMQDGTVRRTTSGSSQEEFTRIETEYGDAIDAWRNCDLVQDFGFEPTPLPGSGSALQSTESEPTTADELRGILRLRELFADPEA
jgi:hypothetical protein